MDNTDAGVFRFKGLTFNHFENDLGPVSNMITRIYNQRDSSLILIGEYPMYYLK